MLENEAAIRLGFFLGTLLVLAFLERWAPRRVLNTPKPARWFANLGIVTATRSSCVSFSPFSLSASPFCAGRRGGVF